MRNFLVTKFVCSACGGILKLTRELPQTRSVGYTPYAEGEPTGADMVDQAVGIVPCECVTKKLEAIRGAAKILFDAAENGTDGGK
jgi:hypothetical protein